jgi:hypothetical protein
VVTNYFDPYNPNPSDPWWIKGWTAQNRTVPAATPPTTPPAFPADIPLINVVATYLDDDTGVPLQGSILVRPNATYQDKASGSTVLPRVRRYDIVNGALNIQLPASDSAALEASFTYTVREAFPGGRQFAINVPSAAGSAPQELHSLIIPDGTVIPIDSMPPMYGWQYPAVE